MSAPLIDRVFRDPKTGQLAIAQCPNAPLAVFLVTSLARRAFHPSGGVAAGLSVLGGLALIWWAVAELGWGDSLFRRILGGVVIAGMAASLLMW